jgi:hypothetical protein
MSVHWRQSTDLDLLFSSICDDSSLNILPSTFGSRTLSQHLFSRNLPYHSIRSFLSSNKLHLFNTSPLVSYTVYTQAGLILQQFFNIYKSDISLAAPGSTPSSVYTAIDYTIPYSALLDGTSRLPYPTTLSHCPVSQCTLGDLFFFFFMHHFLSFWGTIITLFWVLRNPLFCLSGTMQPVVRFN